MLDALRPLMLILVGSVALGACLGVERVSPVQTSADRQDVQQRIQPTVREIADPDVELLWKAALGFMRRFLRGESSLDLVDERLRVIETKTLEWVEGPLAHRTRVTIEIARDPRSPRGVRLGVVALLIEPILDVTRGVTGRPLTDKFALIGNNPEIEQRVADQIMRRYLLLRQGRDPDTVPIEGLPELRRAE